MVQTKKYALIVAGGSGTRMQQQIPKQFLNLHGTPILMHTIKVFFKAQVSEIIVVLPNEQFSYWHQLCEKYQFKIPHQLVAGGSSRFESVNNGLNQINNEINNNLVAIHDGVRPLVSEKIIHHAFEVASEKGNSVVAVRLKDSIREVNLLSNKNVNRINYYLVQTPQTFLVSEIKMAYAKADHNNFTDDASVLESTGKPIFLIEGSYSNIKITTPEDLLIAEALMQIG